MSNLTIRDKEFLDRLNEHYDNAIKDILRRLQSVKPLNKLAMMKILMEAQKRYWVERIDMIDDYTIMTAERTAAALSIPYANAAEELANRVKSIYSNYERAFDLTQKEAKELLATVKYDRSIADNLKAMAEQMAPGAERDRVLAELSAPAYRYRMERAGEMYRQATEICDQIARNETEIVRDFLQTDIEREANITMQELGLPQPAEAVVDMLSDKPEPEQPETLPTVQQSTEVAAPAPIRDFTPTNDAAVAPSFTLISPERVELITGSDWDGKNFSERIWANTDELAKEVKDVLLWGELTGASEDKMAARIRDRFDVAMYKARRVVRTEHTYNCAQSKLADMKKLDFKKYRFCSLHEEADCEHCDDLDGQIFPIDEAAVGINLPPIHPMCRCRITCVPVTVEEIEQEIDDMLRDMGMQEGEDPDEFISRKVKEQIAADEQAKAREAEENSVLTAGQNGGIMENERQTRSVAFAVPKGMTESREFREKFNSMSDDKNIQREYYQAAKEMLHHRSGNNGEDLYYYNTRTGVWYKSTTGTEAGKPDYNDEILRGLKESKRGEIVSFHNHPEGKPPSDSDLNAAFDNGYSKGYTLGHNGSIFEYTPPQYRIDESVYLNRVSSHKADGLDEYESQLKALFDLKELYGFEIREV